MGDQVDDALALPGYRLVEGVDDDELGLRRHLCERVRRFDDELADGVGDQTIPQAEGL